MKKIKLIVISAFCLMGITSIAQPGGFNISERVAEEKNAVLEKLPDLTEDQKTILDDIYKDFIADIDSTRTKYAGNRDEMRSNMMQTRKNKIDALKDLLSDEQYASISELVESRGRRGHGNHPER